MEENRPPSKRNPLVIGIILVVIGLIFILRRFLDLGGIGRLWPLFLFLPVIPLVRALIRDPRKNAENLIPLAILVILGVYFLWLNYTGWERVARTWPNFILAPGIGLMAAWIVTRERKHLTSGIVLLGFGLLMYIRIFLENAGIGMDRYLMLGILLVAVGIVVIVIRLRGGGPKNRE